MAGANEWGALGRHGARMVRFTDIDGYLLWSLPDPGCDLAYWVLVYTFINRVAEPSYADLAGCLHRAVLAGALPPPVGGRYRFSPEWVPRVRQWDGQFPVSEDGMIAFAEWLSSRDWPVVNPAGFVLPREEYETAVVGRPR